MDYIYDRNGAAIAMIQHDGNRTNTFDRRGEFLGWSDGQDIYSYDGGLVARGKDALGMLWRDSDD